MAKTLSSDDRTTARHREEGRPVNASSDAGAAKKDFVEPQLERHASLPDVTTGFVGTFTP